MRFKITWSNCEYRVSIPRYKGGEVVTADEHDTLRARHAALVDEIAQRQETEDSLTRWVHDLGVKYAALVEAVAWERECCQDIRPLVAWADLYARHGEDYVDAIAEELREIQDAARSEVDRLIANETADCKGKG